MDKTRPACNHLKRDKTAPPRPRHRAAAVHGHAGKRTPVLWRSVLDWDESLYFLMAQQWRLGHLPYTTIWDNKPIGIYAIFAAFQAVFGDGIFAIRIATVAFVSLLAFTVFKITQMLTGSRARRLGRRRSTHHLLPEQ